MIKKRLLILLSVILLSLGGFLIIKKSPPVQNLAQISVNFFPFTDQPTIQIEIENKNYSLLLDLGSSHPIDLRKEKMKKIKNKQFADSSEYVGIRGKAYPTQGFRLPKVILANLTIDGLIGFEENSDFLDDAKISQSTKLWNRFKNTLELLMIDGRIGWTFFKEGVAFFNFPQSELIIAKNITAFTNEARYSLKEFIQIPFQIEKWGITLLIETDLGPQQFLLDTGATHSVIRNSIFPENLASNLYTSNKLKIKNNQLGPWKFLLFEYNNEMRCDGILGVDFFKRHLICLDFQNHTAYIKPHEHLKARLISFFMKKKRTD